MVMLHVFEFRSFGGTSLDKRRSSETGKETKTTPTPFRRAACAVSAHLHCPSAEDSGLYSGGVALGGGDSAGNGFAEAAMSFVFVSSRNFVSSGKSVPFSAAVM
jgi:hypothetical protein